MASPTRVGTDASSVFNINVTTCDLTLTVPSTGQNRALIVLCGLQGQNGSPTSVTWDPSGANQALTQLSATSGTQQTTGNIYYLANPTAGASKVVRVIWSAATNGSIVFAATYQDMVQSSATVLDVTGHTGSASNSHPTQSVTTTIDNDIVISWCGANTASSTMSPDSPQSQIASQVTDARMNMNASDQPKATAGAITSGFTFSGSATSEDIFVAALKYVAPSGGGAATHLPYLNLLGVGQ